MKKLRKNPVAVINQPRNWKLGAACARLLFVSGVWLFASLTCVSVKATEPHTQEKDDKDIFTAVFENDIFAGSDRDYTNGVKFSWLSSEQHMPHLANKIAQALPLAAGSDKRISLAFGQNMYAPEDISQRVPAAGQHPYAGWLYGSVGMIADTGKTLDNVMLTLGMVGPASLAERTQIFVHRATNSTHPEGWDNQLKNEPGIILTYDRKWRSMYQFSPFGMGADVTPFVGGNLGNINTDASVGTTFRLGYDLPADYGPPRIRPSLSGSDFFIPTQAFGGYLFTTVSGRAVGRNIFLDGNSFQNSVHVDKKSFVSSLQFGAAMTFGQARLSYTHVFMTKEYATQNHAPVFGALTLSYRF